jgi:outer membrane protein assembly factor BamB/plastocyanin
VSRPHTARLAALAALGVLAAATVPALADGAGPAPARPLPGCADDSARPGGVHPGGEWRNYGGDLRNTRSQPAETVIDPTTAGSLAPAWTFLVEDHGSGIINSTPIIADGCAYFGTSSGDVFAVNADTGALVWKVSLPVEIGGLLCSGVVGSTVVRDGRVFVIVSQGGAPYVVALQQATGAELWRRTMDETPGVYDCASPVVHDGMVLAAFTGDQTAAVNRGGYVVYDAETGEQLAKTYTIPDEQIGESKGGGIWSTAAVDEATGFAYVGTSNPDPGPKEHPHTNALLKIDLNRGSATFGQIVDSYKGTPDTYVDRPVPPTCITDPAQNVILRGVACTQGDWDFGASPNLLEGPDGRLRVGNLQKSGVYHLADATTMDGVWETVVAPPTFYGSAATAATDGRSIFVATSPPGQMVSLDGATGLPQWADAIADAIHYQGVTYANGVVVNNDAKGFLNIWRASDGFPLAKRRMSEDAGRPYYAEEGSGSASVARNTVYVGASNFLIAYRPGGTSALPAPPVPVPDVPTGGTRARALAGPAAVTTGFVTSRVVVPRGAGLDFTNLDTAAHDLTSRQRDASGKRLFASDIAALGTTRPVKGVELLPPGDYDFLCSVHPAMTGTLSVAPTP